jgi:chorismate mutase/prephenate dehydrogenase
MLRDGLVIFRRCGYKQRPTTEFAHMSLDQLRLRLNDLDRRLLELVAERQAASREIASAKSSTGYATRDFAREREVLLRARANAAELGVSPDVGEALLKLLIRSSLTTQEQARVVAHSAGSGRRALVVGGAGKIGGWFSQFLASQGFGIDIIDPTLPGAVAASLDAYRAPLDHDFTIVATPLGATNSILLQLAERRPTGVVFDVGSLKSPLRTGLAALQAAKVRVTSVHPMFGPNTELLSGRHVIFIDLGDAEALAAAQGQFAPTMAELVVMRLEEHDHAIAYVLGLSHAVNIAFFTALAESGETAPRLVQLSSTTFDAQFDVASKVAEESPALYFEIQRLNDYGAEALQALERAVATLRAAVNQGDAARFTQLMTQGFEYTRGRRQITERRA